MRRPPRSTEERLVRAQKSMMPGTLGGRVASAAPMSLDVTRLDPRLRAQKQPTGSPGGGFDPNADPVVIGSGANGNGFSGTIVLGLNAYGNAYDLVVAGRGADAESDGAIAIGANAYVPASSVDAVAIGYAASAQAALGTAVGGQAVVTSAAPNGTAIGYSSKAQHDHGVAIGYNARTLRDGNIMLGRNATGSKLHLSMNDDDAIYLYDIFDDTVRSIRINSGVLVIT